MQACSKQRFQRAVLRFKQAPAMAVMPPMSPVMSSRRMGGRWSRSAMRLVSRPLLQRWKKRATVNQLTPPAAKK